MASKYSIASLEKAARQWLAQRRLAAHGLAVRELAAEELRPLRQALKDPVLGPHALDLSRQALQELCIAAAWVGRRPVGMGLIEWSGPRCEDLRGPWPGVPEIHRLHVLPDYRSLRVGARLIGFLELLALQRGKTRIGLGVHRSNTRALALYRRLGYGPDATPFTDQYLGPGPGGVPRRMLEPALFLVRELSPAEDQPR